MHPTNQKVCRKIVNIKRTCVGIAVIPEGLPKKYRIIFGVTFNLFSQLFTHFDIRLKECIVPTGWKWYHSKGQNPADCSPQELWNSSLRYQGRRGGQRLTISIDQQRWGFNNKIINYSKHVDNYIICVYIYTYLYNNLFLFIILHNSNEWWFCLVWAI